MKKRRLVYGAGVAAIGGVLASSLALDGFLAFMAGAVTIAVALVVAGLFDP